MEVLVSQLHPGELPPSASVPVIGAMASTSSDLDHFRVIVKEETQQLREELRRDISEIRNEQPTLERLLSGNMGQVGQVMPPELIRWGEGVGSSVCPWVVLGSL